MSTKRVTMNYKHMVQTIVDANDGNITKASKQIGVTHACVRHWLGLLDQTEPKAKNIEKIIRAYNEI